MALADIVGAAHVGWDSPEFAYGGDRNHLNVWSRLAQCETEWAVVLEDDAQPLNDFHLQLGGVLKAAPTGIVSLYLGKGYPRDWQPGIEAAIQRAHDSKASFIVSGRLLHCVGVAIRTELISSLLAMPNQALPIDEHITRWAQWKCEQPAIAYTVPSLVNHADGPTIINQHNDGIPRTLSRRAWRVGRRATWDSTVVEMGPQ